MNKLTNRNLHPEPTFQSGDFDILPDPAAADLASLQARIDDLFSSANGWVCYTSGVIARHNGKLWSSRSGESGKKGCPLSGEWVRDGVSWSLRQRGEGWTLVSMRRIEGQSRIVDHKLLGDAPPGTPLRYEVLWSSRPVGAPTVGVWSPVASRFTGFGGQE